MSNQFYLQIHLNKNKPQLSVLVFYLDLSIRKYNYGYGQVSKVDISVCSNYLHLGSITCFCSKVSSAQYLQGTKYHQAQFSWKSLFFKCHIHKSAFPTRLQFHCIMTRINIINLQISHHNTKLPCRILRFYFLKT